MKEDALERAATFLVTRVLYGEQRVPLASGLVGSGRDRALCDRAVRSAEVAGVARSAAAFRGKSVDAPQEVSRARELGASNFLGSGECHQAISAEDNLPVFVQKRYGDWYSR
ncbi:MAG: hypothetical protein ACOC0O_00120 [Spirochaetota bacterium]